MKNRIIILYVIFTFLSINNCSTTEPPPPEKPPGYQEDIPWPSLADSPWPMGRKNPQTTGRSNFTGPYLTELEIIWDSLYVTSGVTIGSDSTIYFLSAYSDHSGLYACYPNGELKWRIPSINDRLIFGWASPIITSEGSIYFTTWQNLVKVNQFGEILWIYPTDEVIAYDMINIGPDGIIYLVNKSPRLYAISSDGVLEWSIEDSRFRRSGYTGLSFSPDGKTIYIPGEDVSLIAVDVESQNIKWTFGESILHGAPLVDSNGNIYLQSRISSINDGKSATYSLDLNGSVRWSYVHNNPLVGREDATYSEGTMDVNGNYYFASDTLYSMNYEGILRWKRDLGDYTYIPLVSDILANIYVIPRSGTELFLFSSEGEQVSQINFADSNIGLLGAPSIGADRSLYLPNSRASRIFQFH